MEDNPRFFLHRFPLPLAEGDCQYTLTFHEPCAVVGLLLMQRDNALGAVELPAGPVVNSADPFAVAPLGAQGLRYQPQLSRPGAEVTFTQRICCGVVLASYSATPPTFDMAVAPASPGQFFGNMIAAES